MKVSPDLSACCPFREGWRRPTMGGLVLDVSSLPMGDSHEESKQFHFGREEDYLRLAWLLPRDTVPCRRPHRFMFSAAGRRRSSHRSDAALYAAALLEFLSVSALCNEETVHVGHFSVKRERRFKV